MRTKLLIIIAAMALPLPAPGTLRAGEPRGNTVSKGYSTRLWRIEDGLPQNRILSLAQTPDGYLWVGTSDGLARFDGVRFTVFDHSNTPALRDNTILVLLAGRDGTLWIGTEGGGLAKYKDGTFQSFSGESGLTNGFVRAIYEDSERTIWVGTDRGFFRRSGERFERLDGTSEIPLASVGGIAADQSGKLWAHSPDGLMLVVNGKLRRNRENCTSFPMRYLIDSGHGFIWGFGPAGASRLRNGCAVPDRELPRVSMRSLAEDADGSLWIGTVGRGLVLIRNQRQISFDATSGLPDNNVNAILVDREQNVWVGCEDGLVRFSKSSVVNLGTLDGFDDDDVLTIYQDRTGDLWLTTVTGQVYRVSGNVVGRFRLPAPAADLIVRTVFQDSRGGFWFGTFQGGLARQNGSTVTVYSKKDGLRSNVVRQFLEDGSGAIWIGLESGLSRWDGKAFRNYYLPEGLSYPSTRCMILDNRGDILVGTDAGLNRIHNGEIVRDAEFAAFAKEKIWALHQDTAGTLWLGTRGGGLLRYRPGELTRFTKDNGLPDNSVFRILEDRDGKLWMSTSSGVISVKRRELDDAARSRDPHLIRIIPYGTAEGMLSSQMNGGFQPAGWMTSSGDLWFPTVKGAVRIDPLKIHSTYPTPVLIERLVAGSQSVPLSGTVTLPPATSRLEFDFTMCDLLTPQRVRIWYTLEGFDHTWSPAGRERSVSYTNVPPGRYRFRVMASDAALSSEISQATLPFTLRPSFYQTNWFYFLLALAGAGLIGIVFGLYARQTRARYSLLLVERTRLAREMHDTVIQGCVGVSALLEAVEGLKQIDSAEAARFLNEARAQVIDTVEEARKAVWDLRHPTRHEPALTMLFNLARKLGIEHGIEVETEITPAEHGSPDLLPPETDRTVFLVGREALRNAVAHSHARRIRLRIAFETASLILNVSDDGVGFSPETSTHKHFGLIGMRERVEGSGGVLSITSRPGAGTSIVATIPMSRG